MRMEVSKSAALGLVEDAGFGKRDHVVWELVTCGLGKQPGLNSDQDLKNHARALKALSTCWACVAEKRLVGEILLSPNMT